MKLVLANPRGFCAGVDRAIAIVEGALDCNEGPVFVRHAIVHNNVVIERLSRRGAIFVEKLSEVPPGSRVVLSAHGSPPEVYAEAKALGLRVFDGACPLVTKVHLEVARHAKQGRAVAVIGHRDHVEVQGILGYYDNPNGDGAFVVEEETDVIAVPEPRSGEIAYVTQTTLAVDQTLQIVAALAARFPRIIAPHRQDICYATQNRQDAVRQLAKDCDLILVIGAAHSSNSTRLVEVAQRAGVTARLIETADEIGSGWLEGVKSLGLTSSASAPEYLVDAVIERLEFPCRRADP